MLRVSATSGLGELIPAIESSGSSAAAMDLVFPEIGLYIESLRAHAATVILVRRASSPLSASALAAALRGKELLSARALDERRIEARFADNRTAALVAQYEGLGLDVGPFRVAEQDDRRIRLVRRSESAIDAIEILASTRADEWRKLLAHELDVVPWAASIYRNQFRDMESIRVLDIPPSTTDTLFFNVRSPVLANAAVRRRIAAAIHREALARLACGEAACAAWQVISSDEKAPLPARMTIIVPADSTTLMTTAKILRHQLFQIGVELVIEPLPLADYMERLQEDFVLAIGPLPLEDRMLPLFLSPAHPQGKSFCNFASPEYDAAYDRGDIVTAKAILAREVPFTRLYESRSFAAVDSSFCGDVVPAASSWLWLSELYPCEEGPPP